jgi:iron complex outermembrane receptor protein
MRITAEMRITLLARWAAAVLAAAFFAQAAAAQSEEATEAPPEHAFGDEIVVVGSRSTRPRSVIDSPVPVDVISGDDFNATGNIADVTDNLKAMVPSYTATPATGDGSAFVRPTSLRGTAPDQTLVLVNGKRRHRSALVQFFAPAAGNGAHGPDVAMIPSIAIKSVEVLRDGAAAQYGSDAIAGVINFMMKDAADGAEVHLLYGEHYDGEQGLKAAVNAGFAVGDRGFVNLSLEHVDNDALSRGVQRPNAQALIDAGVTGVGADAPFGDEPLVQTWGRPETSGTRFFLNSSFGVSDRTQLYLQTGYAETTGRFRFFYRPPDHPSLVPLRAQGFTGLPGGYTPFLDGDQTDSSIVAGLNGYFENDMTWDLSVSFGKNHLDYLLNNTINPDVGLVDGVPGQRDFDVGAYAQEELNVNLDFSQPLSDTLNLAFGAEWREETYIATVGEPSSYLGAGANGLRGIAPGDAGEFSRDNVAVYLDLEHDISSELLLQYALRYEDFSDFGGTLNWKVATRYNASDNVTLRAAASTGFHAPTPGQANVRTTITTFDGVTGLQVEEGLVPSTSPPAREVGGKALTEETSFNLSAGFSASLGAKTVLTVDAYKIEVDDRIYRTRDIAVPGTTYQAISFYTNALDVESAGVDVVLTSGIAWASSAYTDLTLALSFNEIDVVGQTPVGGINPVSDGIIEDIANNYPDTRFVLTTNTFFSEDWNLMFRLNYYGEHYDERGRIGAAVAPSYEVGATLYADLELGFQLSDGVRLVLGAVNVFDEYVDEIGEPYSNRLSAGLQYPRRSAANYEGGSWYLKSIFKF